MLATGALLVSLLALSACSSNPIVQTRTVTVHDPVIVTVPRALTQPVAVPGLSENPNNSDLAHYILVLRQALADANAKLQQIAGLK